MNQLNKEQLRDLMHAVRHYQYHHISINNPRYEEFSHILNVLEQNLPNENISGYSRHTNSKEVIFDRFDRRSDNESIIDSEVWS